MCAAYNIQYFGSVTTNNQKKNSFVCVWSCVRAWFEMLLAKGIEAGKLSKSNFRHRICLKPIRLKFLHNICHIRFCDSDQHYDAIDVICIVKWYYILLSIVYKFVTVNLVSYALRIFLSFLLCALYSDRAQVSEHSSH